MKKITIQTTINMFTIAIYAIILIAVFFYLSNTSITLSPFKIHLETPLMGLGWTLLSAGVLCITISAHQSGYNEGAHETLNTIENALDSIQKRQEDSIVQDFHIMEQFHDSLNNPLNY